MISFYKPEKLAERVTIGIPRALYYHEFFPFLACLPVRIRVSGDPISTH